MFSAAASPPSLARSIAFEKWSVVKVSGLSQRPAASQPGCSLKARRPGGVIPLLSSPPPSNEKWAMLHRRVSWEVSEEDAAASAKMLTNEHHWTETTGSREK